MGRYRRNVQRIESTNRNHFIKPVSILVLIGSPGLFSSTLADLARQSARLQAFANMNQDPQKWFDTDVS
jgi:hypothetical protein